MSYSLSASDGAININISDGTFDNSTSLTLAGPNSVGYGQSLDQNLLNLLTSFASNSSPAGTNVQGQLWFNKGHQSLEVFTTNGYVPVSGITVSSLQPLNPNQGNMWFSTGTNQLYCFDGTNWDLIGPTYTKAQGLSGAIPVLVVDQSSNSITHNVVQIQYGSVIIATLSSDPTFTPAGYDPGFPSIRQGITFNGNLTSPSINANITGNVAGNLVGTTVTATNFYGNVTGTTVVAPNLIGNVVGGLTGNVVATTVTASSLSGNVTGPNATHTNVTVTNLSASNVLITSGAVTGVSNFAATNGNVTNLTTANLNVSNGQLTNMTNIVSTNATVGAITASTIQATVSATINALTATSSVVSNQTVGTGVTTNFSTANAQITGGNVAVTNLNASSAAVTNTITVGTIVATTGSIPTLSATNLYASAVNAGSLLAPIIGNTGTVLNGSISATNAIQSNITGVGTLTQGVWQASTIGGTYGGTGVNNGSYTLTIQNASQVLNQNVAVSASPTFGITNFTGTNTNLSVGVATKANVVTTGGFTIQQVGSKLYFQYNGSNIASLDSGGNLIVSNDISGFTTP